MIEETIGPSSFILGYMIATLVFIASFRYKKLATSFFFLGMAFLSYGTAETYWYVLDETGTEAYNTNVDLFYVAYYWFAILHVIYTLKALGAKFTIEDLILSLAVAVSLIGIYVVASVGEDTPQDLLAYGGAFVAMASILAALALVAILKMKNTRLTAPWLLIGAAIFLASITDVWYYAQENVTGYEYGQFSLMDGLWLVTDIIMLVGVVIHWKKI